ncbi:N-acetyltransferase family protein [Microbacterium gorillae]|uniref:GNAT family N-acetyltransferase n=1 Tax=Microbacterium gorillae TaxID=1231063 RepID=UPI003D98032D
MAPLRFDIRQAALPDAHGLAEVHVRAWREAYAGRMPQSLLDGLSVSDRIASWQRILTSEAEPEAPWRSWLSDNEGRVAGFISIGPSRDEDLPPHIELYALYVLADAYGSGAGQALMDVASDFARPTSLWVLDDNPRAQAFYRRNGFAFDGAEKVDEYNGVKLRELRMVRDEV